MAAFTVERLKLHLAEHPIGRNVAGFSFRACPPCSRQDIETAEKKLGFALPDVLREIYMRVANGGFGPGYGLMGVDGGFTDDLKQSVVDAYKIYDQSSPEDPNWDWPEGWVPICHWGCVIYSVVDCIEAPHAIYFADISAKEPAMEMKSIFYYHKASLEQWLGDWMDGKDLWAEDWKKVELTNG